MLLMMKKALGLYQKAVDNLMEKMGCITRDRCNEVFGGVPDYLFVGLTGITIRPFLRPNTEYVDLGPYMLAYKKIVESAASGEKELTLRREDFSGSISLFNFEELERLKSEATQKGRHCLIQDLELSYDFGDLMP